MVVPLWALNTKNLCSPKKWTKVHQNCLGDATPENHAKFCGNRLKNARDIRNQKFLLPESVGQSSTKIFRGCYPLRPLILPNFIEIGQTSLEKSVKSVTFSVLPDIFLSQTGRNVTTWVASRSMREARLIKTSVSKVNENDVDRVH